MDQRYPIRPGDWYDRFERTGTRLGEADIVERKAARSAV